MNNDVMAQDMKKHIGKYLFFALSFFISFICYAQEPKNEMIPVSVVYDEKLNGMSLEETIKMFGEPSIKLNVNSTSSKRNMPPFLVDYFNSHEELVEVLVCRWHEIKKINRNML